MSVEGDVEKMPEAHHASLRVAYDGWALASGDGGTGKGLQLRNLISSRWAEFRGYAPSPKGQERIAGLIQGGSRRYLFWQQASLPRLIKPWKPDVFLAPYNTAPLWLPRGIQLLLVLHDLILMEKFKASTARMRIVNSYRRRLISPSVTRSSYVLTVSEFSRNQILKQFPFARVRVIPCTVAESWFVEPASLHERENYILLVTATPAHKNAARALRAYAHYVGMAGAGAANLRIVGLALGGEPFQKMVQELGLNARVVFEPFIPTVILQQLYRRAKAVLVPSLREGFGIPVLEGMASGTPVIASRSSSLPEVGGRALYYFDPSDEKAMAESIFELSGNPLLWSEKAREGQLQVRKFHPAIVSRQVDDFWFEIAFERGKSP
ncbi:MAG: glycosyltransferase family 1 protein [Acidobacteriaceae bacterium]